ncbi:E1-E2 ATPase-domain-containing protein [Microdochium trichocladiopsis]|uniref:E1-E2 ATPase-domain-containing protein n=1 Tax=Microdochium trichocladiopsis TaxID=1682393 RepID=A0A9P8XSP2_9PEZI|nr:E1-E2 ATPase-domain-containing protein [Microdochium trichocladiopsis]KAH7012260.1 E1-E2 ATPase-domain-containing protein [Microdochium trichocladiopsis]
MPLLTCSDGGPKCINIESATALKPDPGTEADVELDNNPFAFIPGHFDKLVNPKSLAAFRALGGLKGIERACRQTQRLIAVSSNVSFGQATRLNSDKLPAASERLGGNASEPFADRIRVYGKNVLPAKRATPYKDDVIILLNVDAIISLALGLYEVFGVAICAAILIMTLVGSLNDWQKEKALVKLNAKKENREVKVFRSGKSYMISVHDVVVGDVLHLEPGDLVPSSATGKSDALKKTPGHEVMERRVAGADPRNLDPFIISGAKVLEGMGKFMVTSVGVNSSFGKIMMSVRTKIEATLLQKKLEGLAVAIAKIGGSSAALLLFVNTDSTAVKASQFMDILIVAITIIVVALLEGLPLAVTLALAITTKRMLKENNVLRVLRACETMGNATTICSDKTGTLTTNKMTVTLLLSRVWRTASLRSSVPRLRLLFLRSPWHAIAPRGPRQ